jgi:hypothetical protein
VLLVLAWLGLCAVLLLGARRDATQGLDAVNAAKKRTAPSDVLEGAPIGPLQSARRSFNAAHDKLASPAVAPLKLLPVLGRQLKAATSLVGAAADVADAGAQGVIDAKAALAMPHETGTQRITLLRSLHDIAERADRRLRAVDLGPSRALFGIIADKRADLADKLGSVQRGAHDASVATAGLADLLTGPRRYLVLAANNAEMRAGAGDFLSAGELTLENGTFALGELQWTGGIKVPPAAAPPIEDKDLADRWGFLVPNQEWRNLGLSPRFTASAQLAARMWPAIGGAQVDGVIAIDPIALRALLQATGPVGDVNADNVVDRLLHDQYAALPAPGARFDVAQAARRDALGQIARSVIERLSKGPFDVAGLAGSLADAARGRHLLAWSARPADQAAWEAASVDGALKDSSLMVSLLNRGGNKLDYFMRVAADFTPTSVTVTLRNTTPEGENVYVAGPYPDSGAGAGEYAGFVAVTLPAFASNVTVDGFEKFSAAGPDGPAQVIAVPVAVRRGATLTVTVRFTLPARGSLTIEPSARVPATEWHAEGKTFRDNESRVVEWR